MAVPPKVKLVEGWFKMGFKSIKDMFGSDGGNYQYSYNPENQTYSQLSGPDGGLLKRISSMIKNSNGMKKGGKVSSASKRADGIAIRGKTRA
jgi:hypothetical protein